MFTLYWSTLDQQRVLVTGVPQRVLSPTLVTQHVYPQVSVLDGTVSLQDWYPSQDCTWRQDLQGVKVKRDYKSGSPGRGLRCCKGRKSPQECVHPEKKKVTVCRRRQASGEADPAGALTVDFSLHNCEKRRVYILSHPVCGVLQWKPRMTEAGKSASHKSHLQCYLYTLLSTPSITYKDTESDAGETRCNKTSSLLLGLRI